MSRTSSSPRRRLIGTVGVLSVAAVAITVITEGPAQAAPDQLTFDLMDTPLKAKDRVAQERFPRSSIPVSEGRLLGVDSSGRNYLIVPQEGEICLLVSTDATSVAVACSDPKTVAKHGLWVEFGTDSESYMALAVPDQYRNAKVSTSGTRMVENDHLVAVQTKGRGQDHITLRSSKYKDFRAEIK